MPTASSTPLLNSTPQTSNMDARELSLFKPVASQVNDDKGVSHSPSLLRLSLIRENRVQTRRLDHQNGRPREPEPKTQHRPSPRTLAHVRPASQLWRGRDKLHLQKWLPNQQEL
jgi:hypothetical protein